MEKNISSTRRGSKSQFHFLKKMGMRNKQRCAVEKRKGGVGRKLWKIRQ